MRLPTLVNWPLFQSVTAVHAGWLFFWHGALPYKLCTQVGRQATHLDSRSATSSAISPPKPPGEPCDHALYCEEATFGGHVHTPTQKEGGVCAFVSSSLCSIRLYTFTCFLRVPRFIVPGGRQAHGVGAFPSSRARYGSGVAAVSISSSHSAASRWRWDTWQWVHMTCSPHL